jgi:hypothetical protein
VAVQRWNALWDKFQRAALVGAHLHGVQIVVIMREAVEGQTDLLEVTGTLGLARANFAFGDDGQQEGGEDRDDRDDHEQFDQRERAAAATLTVPETIHGVSLINLTSTLGAVTICKP